jgi:glyoxylase-like metal-dependent hydrolase (beta-lactamase superfamily II)
MDPIVTLDHGITRLDSGYVRPHLDAFYLVVEQGRAAIIDTGTTHSVPVALAALERLGLGRDQVDYVMPTHVHLDHAGGAGALLQELPNARLVVHPRGVRHLVDPSQLIAGSTEVYGAEEMQRAFGTIVPAPPERVIEGGDGLEIDLAGRPLRLLHATGHALHHYVVWDAASRGLFTGDAFGISYREFDTANGAYLFATTTPVQFDPEAWLASIDRLMAWGPEAVYLAHFGRVGDVARLADMLRRDLVRIRNQALAVAEADDPVAAIRTSLENNYLEDLAAHGATVDRARLHDMMAMDLDLNSRGIAIWLARQAHATAETSAAATRTAPG